LKLACRLVFDIRPGSSRVCPFAELGIQPMTKAG
jgi:hypothetical protein